MIVQNIDVVIARYREDISWIAAIPQKCRVWILCAEFLPIVTPRQAKCQIILDGGNEVGSITSYIIQNYGDLPEYVCFCQGNPFDHCVQDGSSYCQRASFMHRLEEYVANPKDEFVSIGDKSVTSSHDPITRRVHLHNPKSPLLQYSKWPLIDACRYLLDRECPDILPVSFGSNFCLSRRLILRYPMAFYEKLQTWACHSPRSFEAALLEKLFPTIFE